MQSNDWFNAAINFVAGVLLGVVIDGLRPQLTSNFWLVAILVPMVFSGIVLFDRLFEGLFDKVFSSGIRSAKRPLPKRRAPLPRLLALPLGVTLGLASAWFGVGASLMVMIEG